MAHFALCRFFRCTFVQTSKKERRRKEEKKRALKKNRASTTTAYPTLPLAGNQIRKTRPRNSRRTTLRLPKHRVTAEPCAILKNKTVQSKTAPRTHECCESISRLKSLTRNSHACNIGRRRKRIWQERVNEDVVPFCRERQERRNLPH